MLRVCFSGKSIFQKIRKLRSIYFGWWVLYTSTSSSDSPGKFNSLFVWLKKDNIVYFGVDLLLKWLSTLNYVLVFLVSLLERRCFQRPVISGTSWKLSVSSYACYEHMRSMERDSPHAFWILNPGDGLGTTWWDGAEDFSCLKVVMGMLFVGFFFSNFLFISAEVMSSSKYT